MSPEERQFWQRRRKKNRVLFWALLALVVLFFAITLIRLEEKPHPPREIGGIKPGEPAPNLVVPAPTR